MIRSRMANEASPTTRAWEVPPLHRVPRPMPKHHTASSCEQEATRNWAAVVPEPAEGVAWSPKRVAN